MLMNRRSFIGASALAAGTALLAPARLVRAAGRRQPAADAPAKPAVKPMLEWRELKKDDKGNTVWAVFGGGGNTMVLDYGQRESYWDDEKQVNVERVVRQALVVDTKMTGFGPVLRRGIESRGMHTAALLNTHHHYDHTGGNNAFVGLEGVTTAAHSNALARILGNVERYTSGAAGAIRDFEKVDSDEARAAVAHAKALLAKLADLSNDDIAALFAPQSGFSGGSANYGDLEVRADHVTPGHTDNDLLVFLPSLNVLHTGDLLFNKVWPYIDRAGGCDTAGWIKCLERAWNMCSRNTIVIPGHGDITDRDAIKRQIDFFKDMRERAAKAAAAGTSREEFLKSDPAEYKDYALADWIKPITLGGLWDEAMKIPVS